MERVVGTVVRGLRGPIINERDNIEQIVVDTVLNAAKIEGYSIEDRDIVTVTESVVARAQGNYASIEDIAADVAAKFGDDTVGVIFPILSRNRFANCLRGIAKGVKKVVLMLSYPSDEVGNHLVDIDELDVKGINPWTDTLTEAEFREHFGYKKHTFTGVDYIEYYKELIEAEGAACEVIFSNNTKT
ncbi:coenzyme F420-0:L-glutamate ligase, partial [Priestia megaterium]|uniref:coenzyme F420-0:L-glutamate ligase n=1 Tax=Priestia megaterium TaxID=1404 RepID=UPI002FFEB781